MQLLLSQFLCAFVLRVNAKQVNLGGVLLESRDSGGGVPPFSQHPDPTSNSKNGIFHTHFQTWALFLESPDIFSGPESGVVFAVFVFKITLSKIFGKFCNKTIS